MVEREVLERIEFSSNGYCPVCDGWMVDEWRGATPGKHTPTCELAKAIAALQSVEGGVQGSIATKQESCPEGAPRTETATAIYSVLSSACIEHSALSVSGFNLFGDSKSIKAAQEWLHSHSQIGDLKTNLRHWRDECGKLHAQLAKTPSADVCDAGVEQTWDKCPECGASPDDLCGRVFSPVGAETNANAPGNTGLVSGVSSAPDHTTMEER
ncbi:MAG: hypothetical protein AB7V18_20530 [Pyrinomonadaceae bacterium]